MGGKAALIFVLGFSFLMGYTLLNLNSAGTRSVRNMSTYNAMSTSHNMALAGANVGMAKFYRDTTWGSSGPSSISQTFSGTSLVGGFTATAYKVGAGKALRSISTCSANGTVYRDTIDIMLGTNSSNSFTLYAWMTDIENGVFWITGDSVWGKVHSNDNITVSGSPVYMQKVTTAKGFIPPVGKSAKIGSKTYTNSAIFKNPPAPETGVARIDFPTDLSALATAAASAQGRKYTGNIWVTLDGKTSADGDGKVYVRATKTGPIIDSIALADPNFNGVLQGTGVVNVEGKLDGKLTIASYNTPSSTGNNVVIQGDLLYERNPRFGFSNDLLGLVANNNVIVADNVPAGGNREIHGSIFARTGSFTAENYNTRPVNNELRILGSIVQNTRGAVGTFTGSSTLASGFYKRYRYDDRLADNNIRPPAYPGFIRKSYSILNWWESYRIMDFE